MDNAIDNIHFTYNAPNMTSLQQGDIVKKSAEINKLLATIHPHYCKPDYEYFLVLTQSCDLVRRHESDVAKAKYITLAAVRPFSTSLRRELLKYKPLELASNFLVCSDVNKYLMKEFIRKVLNNNHPEYFYIEPASEYHIHDRYCAFLRLSVALRCNEHYNTILAAKCLSLNSVFQAKLGWLVGNIYSRVGTEDWKQKDVDAATKSILSQDIMWLPEEQYASVSEFYKKEETTNAEIEEHIRTTNIPTIKDRIIVRILDILKLDPEDREKSKNRLENDPQLRALINKSTSRV